MLARKSASWLSLYSWLVWALDLVSPTILLVGQINASADSSFPWSVLRVCGAEYSPLCLFRHLLP